MNKIDVYYSAHQVSNPRTDSPSPRKPTQVVNDWLRRELPIRIIEPIPATREQLAAAHDPQFVDDILECRRPNGFSGRQRDVADSLPWTTGSFLSAARGALDNGSVTCSPTSGFHHAHYSDCWGYCTFNGLMITACVLKNEGRVSRVGILDCDQHTGDGTRGIMDKLQIDWVRHVTAVNGYPRKADIFLKSLPTIVDEFSNCDLLLYQAGADPHVQDPLGGFLTTSELAERDRIVFERARCLGIPVVWNLAGGYQEPLGSILEIHRNTMEACVSAYVTPDVSSEIDPNGPFV